MTAAQVKKFLGLPLKSNYGSRAEGFGDWKPTRRTINALAKLTDEELAAVRDDIESLFSWAYHQGTNH